MLDAHYRIQHIIELALTEENTVRIRVHKQPLVLVVLESVLHKITQRNLYRVGFFIRCYILE